MQLSADLIGYLRVSLIRERTSGSSRCPMVTLPMSH
jgi:hypothetical protein